MLRQKLILGAWARRQIMETEATSASLLHDLKGHSGDINCCCWSPVDHVLCSCGGDGTLRVWTVPEGKELRQLTAHRFYVNACAYSPAGDLVATASTDTTIKLWSTTSWKTVGELHGHDGAVRWCCFSLDGCLLATASSDDSTKVWEVGSQQCVATLTGHNGSVMCCVFAPSGWLLMTGGSSGEMLFFDVFAKRCMRKLNAHDLGVNCMQIAPSAGDGTEEPVELATAGNDNCIRLWKIHIKEKSVLVQELAVLSHHTSPVYSCAFHPSQRLLVSGSADKAVILWHLDSLKPLLTLASHSRYVTHCSFSPDGNYLVTASNDKTIKLWTLQSGGGGGGGNDTRSNTTGTLDSLSPTEQQLSDTAAAGGDSSLVSRASWSVDEVCAWLQCLSEQQEAGQPSHPDDIRAAQRVAGALKTVTISTSQLRVAELSCAITQEVMRDPVIAQDGYTYERSAITDWLSKGRRTSPVTNLPLPTTLLIPNRLVKTLIEKQNNS